MNVRWLLPLLMPLLWSCERAPDAEPSRSVEAATRWSKANPTVTEETWRGVISLVCTPSLVDVCDNEQCRSRRFKGDHPVVVRWLPQKGEYQRCDAKGHGCDAYRTEVHFSGSFANVSVPESALIFRVTGSGEYREIANLATETFVYRGQCKKE